ncbi:inner ear-specific collagen [Nerophis ophidion]|uniref:inner ear-specific collagen n=1 Tax=Nerophis ophidion TaxID=159077 RepID=UPI002ADF256A|nr:inner ear-specific collagen [Nerophis ophidion]
MAAYCHFLLALVFRPVVMAMPEAISPDNWEPPFETPPLPMPVDGRFYSENMTGPEGGSSKAYCQMLLQSEVPPDQMPWFCLCTDCKSNTGAKRDHGDRGLPGRPGSPGRRGVTGFRGPPGFVGRPGIKGQKGDDGDKGSQGPQGFVGPKGNRGFKGEKGERGLEGLPGEPGPKGDDGVCPKACDAVQGLEGQPGLPGPAGPRGLPGAPGEPGSKGLKGDMGDIGHYGAPGSDGVKGEPGLQGECNCTDGLDGAPGQKGSKGNQGDQGQMGPPGEKGLQGHKGDMGDMDYMGPPGPCMPSIQSAFSAQLMTSYPSPDAPVVFGFVVSNVQGSYDPTSGFYTAPINGTYVFNYHLTVHEKVLKVGLFHNFEPIVKTTEPNVFGTTSHSVVLHLARGDKVWIQVKDNLSNGMYAGGEAASTFSGFLLHPDSCDMSFLRSPLPEPTLPETGFSWGGALRSNMTNSSTPTTTTGSS